MRLERHILKELFSNFLFAAAALYFVAGVLIAIQVFFVGDLPMSSAVTAAPILLLGRAELLTPCAFLTGVVFTYGRLSAELEYMATQACGVHPFRITAPILAAGLLLTSLQLWISNHVVPQMLLSADRVALKVTSDALLNLEPGRTEFEAKQAGFYMSWRNRNGSVFEDVVIDARAKSDAAPSDGNATMIRGRAKQVKIEFEPQAIRFWIYGFQSAQKSFQFSAERFSIALPVSLLGTAASFHAKTDFLKTDVLISLALRHGEYAKWLRATGDPSDRAWGNRLRTDSHRYAFNAQRRAAWAFAPLLLGMLGAPIAIWFRRGTRLGGLVVAFGVFLLIYFPFARIGGDGLAEVVNVPTWISAWMATVVSLILACVFFFRLARR